MTATSLGGVYRHADEELVFLVVETAATADDSDELAVDLGSYGIAEDGLLMVIGNCHTTVNSVVVMNDPTTAVSGGTLTITLGASGGAGTNEMRVFLIIGRSEV
jgi:hypothetical protein